MRCPAGVNGRRQGSTFGIGAVWDYNEPPVAAIDMPSDGLVFNTYFLVVLVALLANYAVHTAADLLNVRSLWRGIPAPLRDVYSAEQYAASQRYVQAATRIEIAERTAVLLVVLLFWFAGGFGWLDGLVRGAVTSMLLRGLLYVGAVALGYLALSVPFDAYRTFNLESRFGFNRTTHRTFIADRMKGLALLFVIGGLVAAVVVGAFLWLGPAAWLICLAAGVVFILLSQAVAPAVILPLFNKFTPMPEGETKHAVLEYARSIDFPVRDVYVIDGSRRSSRANAFFTGLGRHRRIALFDTLVEGHSTRGLVAVLAHEAGHYKRRHVLKGILATSLHMAVLFYLLAFFLGQSGLFLAFGVSESSVYVGLVLFIVLVTPVETALSILFNMLSRRHEYEADRYSVETTNDPSALEGALRKLSVDNLSNPHPHPLQVVLSYSHPPLAERLEAIEALPHRSARGKETETP